MLPSRITPLLDHAIDTPLKLHCIMLFTQRIIAHATSVQISTRLFRDRWSIQDTLDCLVKAQILQLQPHQGEALYVYAPTPELRDQLMVLTRAYEDPMARTEIYDYLRNISAYEPYPYRSYNTALDALPI